MLLVMLLCSGCWRGWMRLWCFVFSILEPFWPNHPFKGSELIRQICMLWAWLLMKWTKWNRREKIMATYTLWLVIFVIVLVRREFSSCHRTTKIALHTMSLQNFFLLILCRILRGIKLDWNVANGDELHVTSHFVESVWKCSHFTYLIILQHSLIYVDCVF